MNIEEAIENIRAASILIADVQGNLYDMAEVLNEHKRDNQGTGMQGFILNQADEALEAADDNLSNVRSFLIVLERMPLEVKDCFTVKERKEYYMKREGIVNE